MNIVTIFERASMVHLSKDVGQFADYLGRNFGCKVELWSFNRIESDLDNVECIFIRSKWTKFRVNLKIFFKLLMKSKSINLLVLYHLRWYNVFYAVIYKVINKNGFVIIKGDFDLNQIKKNGLSIGVGFFCKKIFYYLMRHIDLVTYEHKYIGSLLREFKLPSFYLPNGLAENLKKEIDKKNSFKNDMCSDYQILIVGRIGTYQKNTEEALRIVANVWRERKNIHLNIVGPVTHEFESYLHIFLEENPSMINNITLWGEVNDKEKLAHFYSIADVFMLTSRYEGYPLSLVEAAYAKVIPLVSQGSGADDLVVNFKNGYIYRDEVDATDFLLKIFMNKQLVSTMQDEISKSIIKNNLWDNNVNRLCDYIKSR